MGPAKPKKRRTVASVRTNRMEWRSYALLESDQQEPERILFSSKKASPQGFQHDKKSTLNDIQSSKPENKLFDLQKDHVIDHHAVLEKVGDETKSDFEDNERRNILLSSKTNIWQSSQSKEEVGESKQVESGNKPYSESKSDLYRESATVLVLLPEDDLFKEDKETISSKSVLISKILPKNKSIEMSNVFQNLESGFDELETRPVEKESGKSKIFSSTESSKRPDANDERESISPKKKVKMSKILSADQSEGESSAEQLSSTDEMADECLNITDFLPRRDFVNKSKVKTFDRTSPVLLETETHVNSDMDVSKKLVDSFDMHSNETPKHSPKTLNITLQKLPITPDANSPVKLSKKDCLSDTKVQLQHIHEISSDTNNQKQLNKPVEFVFHDSHQSPSKSNITPQVSADSPRRKSNRLNIKNQSLENVEIDPDITKTSVDCIQLFTKEELRDKLHNKRLKIIIEKVCLDGSIVSLPVETTIHIRGARDKDINLMSDNTDEDSLTFINKKSSSVTVFDLDSISEDKNADIVNQNESSPFKNTPEKKVTAKFSGKKSSNKIDSESGTSVEIVNLEDFSSNDMLEGIEPNTHNNLIEVDCQIVNLNHPEQHAVNTISDVDKSVSVISDEPVDLSAKSAQMKAQHIGDQMSSIQGDAVTEWNDDNKDVILLSGERRGECKHSMPVWDQHDYCWLCRSNKMYFWAQDCQKTGPNCDMCKSWTDDQWNFKPKITTVPSLATASVQEKKKIRKKRRKKRQTFDGKDDVLPKLHKFSDQSHVHHQHGESAEKSFISPSRTSGRRHKAKMCSCCDHSMPLLSPYGFEEEEEEDLEYYEQDYVPHKAASRGKPRHRGKNRPIHSSKDKEIELKTTNKKQNDLPVENKVQEVSLDNTTMVKPQQVTSTPVAVQIPESLQTTAAVAAKPVEFNLLNMKPIRKPLRGRVKTGRMPGRPKGSLNKVKKDRPRKTKSLNNIKIPFDTALHTTPGFSPVINSGSAHMNMPHHFVSATTPQIPSSFVPVTHSVIDTPPTVLPTVGTEYGMPSHNMHSLAENIISRAIPVYKYHNIPGTGKPVPGTYIDSTQISVIDNSVIKSSEVNDSITKTSTLHSATVVDSSDSFEPPLLYGRPISLVQTVDKTGNRQSILHSPLIKDTVSLVELQRPIPQQNVPHIPSVQDSQAGHVKEDSLDNLYNISSQKRPGSNINISKFSIVPDGSTGITSGSPFQPPNAKPLSRNTNQLVTDVKKIETISDNLGFKENVVIPKQHSNYSRKPQFSHSGKTKLVNQYKSQQSSQGRFDSTFTRLAKTVTPITIDTSINAKTVPVSTIFNSPVENVTLKSSNQLSPSQFSPTHDKPYQAKARTKADILARLKWKKTARKSLSEDGVSPSSNASPKASPVTREKCSPQNSPTYGPIPTLTHIEAVLSQKKKPIVLLKDVIKFSSSLSPESKIYVSKVKQNEKELKLNVSKENVTRLGEKVKTPKKKTSIESDKYRLKPRDGTSEDEAEDSSDFYENSDVEIPFSHRGSFISPRALVNDRNIKINASKLTTDDKTQKQLDEKHFGAGNRDKMITQTNVDRKSNIKDSMDDAKKDEDIEPDIPSDLEPDQSDDDEPDYDEWMRATMLDSTAEDSCVFAIDETGADEKTHIDDTESFKEENKIRKGYKFKIADEVEKIAKSRQVAALNVSNKTGFKKQNLDNEKANEKKDECTSSDADGLSSQLDSEAEFDLEKLVAEKMGKSESKVRGTSQRSQADIGENYIEDTLSDSEVGLKRVNEGLHRSKKQPHIQSSGSIRDKPEIAPSIKQNKTSEATNIQKVHDDISMSSQLNDTITSLSDSEVPHRESSPSLKPKRHVSELKVSKDSDELQSNKIKPTTQISAESTSLDKKVIKSSSINIKHDFEQRNLSLNKLDYQDSSDVSSSDLDLSKTYRSLLQSGLLGESSPMHSLFAGDGPDMNSALGVLGLASSSYTGLNPFLQRSDNTTSDSLSQLQSEAIDPNYEYVPVYEEISDSEGNSPMPQPVDLSKQGPYSQINTETPGTNESKEAQEKSRENNNSSLKPTVDKSGDSVDIDEPLMLKHLPNTNPNVKSNPEQSDKTGDNLSDIPEIVSMISDGEQSESERDDTGILNLALVTGNQDHKSTTISTESSPTFTAENTSTSFASVSQCANKNEENSLMIDPNDPNIVKITATTPINPKMPGREASDKIDRAIAFSTDGTNDYIFDESSDSECALGSDIDLFDSSKSEDEKDGLTCFSPTKKGKTQRSVHFDNHVIIDSGSDDEILACTTAYSQQEEVVVISDESDDDDVEDTFANLTQCVVKMSPRSEHEDECSDDEDCDVEEDDEAWGSDDGDTILETMNIDSFHFDWNMEKDNIDAVKPMKCVGENVKKSDNKEQSEGLTVIGNNDGGGRVGVIELEKQNNADETLITKLKTSSSNVELLNEEVSEEHELTQEFCKDLLENDFEFEDVSESERLQSNRKLFKTSNNSNIEVVPAVEKNKRKRGNVFGNKYADLSSDTDSDEDKMEENKITPDTKTNSNIIESREQKGKNDNKIIKSKLDMPQRKVADKLRTETSSLLKEKVAPLGVYQSHASGSDSSDYEVVEHVPKILGGLKNVSKKKVEKIPKSSKSESESSDFEMVMQGPKWLFTKNKGHRKRDHVVAFDSDHDVSDSKKQCVSDSSVMEVGNIHPDPESSRILEEILECKIKKAESENVIVLDSDSDDTLENFEIFIKTSPIKVQTSTPNVNSTTNITNNVSTPDFISSTGENNTSTPNNISDSTIKYNTSPIQLEDKQIEHSKNIQEEQVEIKTAFGVPIKVENNEQEYLLPPFGIDDIQEDRSSQKEEEEDDDVIYSQTTLPFDIKESDNQKESFKSRLQLKKRRKEEEYIRVLPSEYDSREDQVIDIDAGSKVFSDQYTKGIEKVPYLDKVIESEQSALLKGSTLITDKIVGNKPDFQDVNISSEGVKGRNSAENVVDSIVCVTKELSKESEHSGVLDIDGIENVKLHGNKSFAARLLEIKEKKKNMFIPIKTPSDKVFNLDKKENEEFNKVNFTPPNIQYPDISNCIVRKKKSIFKSRPGEAASSQDKEMFHTKSDAMLPAVKLLRLPEICTERPVSLKNIGTSLLGESGVNSRNIFKDMFAHDDGQIASNATDGKTMVGSTKLKTNSEEGTKTNSEEIQYEHAEINDSLDAVVNSSFSRSHLEEGDKTCFKETVSGKNKIRRKSSEDDPLRKVYSGKAKLTDALPLADKRGNKYLKTGRENITTGGEKKSFLFQSTHESSIEDKAQVYDDQEMSDNFSVPKLVNSKEKSLKRPFERNQTGSTNWLSKLSKSYDVPLKKKKNVFSSKNKSCSTSSSGNRNKGRLSPISLNIRKARLAEVARKKSKAASTLNASPSSIAVDQGSFVKPSDLHKHVPKYTDTLDSDDDEDDDILHASQSAEIGPVRRRKNPLDDSQLFQDLPNADIGLTFLRPKPVSSTHLPSNIPDISTSHQSSSTHSSVTFKVPYAKISENKGLHSLNGKYKPDTSCKETSTSSHHSKSKSSTTSLDHKKEQTSCKTSPSLSKTECVKKSSSACSSSINQQKESTGPSNNRKPANHIKTSSSSGSSHHSKSSSSSSSNSNKSSSSSSTSSKSGSRSSSKSNSTSSGSTSSKSDSSSSAISKSGSSSLPNNKSTSSSTSSKRDSSSLPNSKSTSSSTSSKSGSSRSSSSKSSSSSSHRHSKPSSSSTSSKSGSSRSSSSKSSSTSSHHHSKSSSGSSSDRSRTTPSSNSHSSSKSCSSKHSNKSSDTHPIADSYSTSDGKVESTTNSVQTNTKYSSGNDKSESNIKNNTASESELHIKDVSSSKNLHQESKTCLSSHSNNMLDDNSDRSNKLNSTVNSHPRDKIENAKNNETTNVNRHSILNNIDKRNRHIENHKPLHNVSAELCSKESNVNVGPNMKENIAGDSTMPKSSTVQEDNSDNITHTKIKSSTVSSLYELPSPLRQKHNVSKNVHIQSVKNIPSKYGTMKAAILENNTPRTIDDFLKRILTWNTTWLTEQEKLQVSGVPNVEPPPIVSKDEQFLLLETYDSYEDYVRIMTPLFLMETWDSVYKHWLDNRSRTIKMNMYPVGVKNDNKKLGLMDMIFQGTIAHGRNIQCPSDGDLVVCHLLHPDRHPEMPPVIRPVFGHVTGKKMGFKNFFEDVHSEIKKSLQNSSMKIVELRIKLCNRKRALIPMIPMKIEVVDSLVSQLRQYSALLFLPRSPLARDILRPINTKVFQTNSVNEQNSGSKLSGDYNKSQRAAVSSICNAVKEEYTMPKILLVQGPPGTGKSTTIAATIHNIVQGHSATLAFPKARILLCAPSNGGIDELARKLIRERKAVSSRKLEGKGLNVVRIGKQTSVNEEVQPYCLNTLVENSFKQYRNQQLKESMSSVHTALISMTAKIDSVLKTIESLVKQKKKQEEETELLSVWGQLRFPIQYTSVRTMDQCFLGSQPASQNISKLRATEKYIGQDPKADRMEKELVKLQRRKQQIENSVPNNKPMTPRENATIKKKILMDADIVCCTLNSSGSSQLSDSIPSGINSGTTGGMYTSTPVSHFTCVIIDEATQTTELDSLIPLVYGCSKLVLVGDPEQLPATVISKGAEKRNFSQSLFERFYEFFKLDEHNPVQMLQEQYRMHPEICQFPSQYIYYGKLFTNSDVVKKRSIFPLKPYLMFNITYTQEQQVANGSTFNPLEAEVVVTLCQEIRQHDKLKDVGIGVVTPYQKQKHVIIDLFRKRGVGSIEVSTVDAYQGREKDVIVMSCVRAKSKSGNIGFVGNRQRLNVCLTRAKYAMYIVGDLNSLEVSEDWYNVIKDANKRKCIYTIKAPTRVAEILRKNILKQ